MRTFWSRVIFGAIICTIRTRCISWDLCKSKRKQNCRNNMVRDPICRLRSIAKTCNILPSLPDDMLCVMLAFISSDLVSQSLFYIFRCENVALFCIRHTRREWDPANLTRIQFERSLCDASYAIKSKNSLTVLFNFSTADSLRHRFYFCVFFLLSLRTQLTVREREFTIESWENILHCCGNQNRK